MIKAIFFDWGETLGTFKDVIDFSDLLTQDEIESFCLMESLDKLQTLSKDRKQKILFGLENVKINLYEDSLETIINLKKKGYKICLVSNTYPVTPSKIRREFKEILSHFDVISFSSELGMMKPNKEIFEHTLRELNKINDEEILPEEVVMIGDKEKYDIFPAQNLGMQAKLIDRKKQSLKDLFSSEE
jgi:HAD superfamily hydrolase (TIGR01549 family)